MSKLLGKFITRLIKLEVNTQPGSQGKQNISHNSLHLRKKKQKTKKNKGKQNKLKQLSKIMKTPFLF